VSSELIAVLDSRKTGRVVRDPRGRLSFTYDESWRHSRDAYPLSLSMPLALATHGQARVEAFLWGLLPDSEGTIERWAAQSGVSPRNVFGLIRAKGEDCAGAVQFVTPERLDLFLGPDSGEVQWLDESAIAERLQMLRRDHSAWRTQTDTGQFSLAGAQPKTAFLFDKGRWGVPSGRLPTTHILKPPTSDLAGRIENEHFCLELARLLGLPVIDSNIAHFQDETAIVIRRYDRVQTGDTWRRVHQEDLCQALGLFPTKKYQNDGGPSISRIVELLRTNSSNPEEDVRTFIDAVAYSWLIAGTDAHAKNYALLIGAGGQVRLAPLYDLMSALSYPDSLDLHRVKLAMKVGGEYRLRYIGLNHWRKAAAGIRLEPDALLRRLDDFAAQLPDYASTVRQRMRDQGLTNSIIGQLADAIATRASVCRSALRVA